MQSDPPPVIHIVETYDRSKYGSDENGNLSTNALAVIKEHVLHEEMRKTRPEWGAATPIKVYRYVRADDMTEAEIKQALIDYREFQKTSHAGYVQRNVTKAGTMRHNGYNWKASSPASINIVAGKKVWVFHSPRSRASSTFCLNPENESERIYFTNIGKQTYGR
jgi:hypothetical protein